jgi:molybdopterin-guanine dinucleotide biosynthesis protein A
MADNIQVTAAILAGGRATRLGGRNKSELRLGSETIVERQLAVLREVADRTIIVANDRLPFQSYGVPVLPDTIPGCGSLGGVYTAVIASDTDHTLVVAGDMPFLEAPFLKRLIAAGRDADVAVPRTPRGFEPLCASYSRRCAPIFKSRIDVGKLRLTDVLTAEHGLIVRELGPEEIRQYGDAERLFFNINTAEDYARATSLVP